MPITEIELMQKAGMTPMHIIVAGTKNGAHVCNLDHELGTLEAGKIADVLVVDGDPLEDIHALTDVRLVIHNGVVIREE
jgi:imidazolonepropionase-like amidohydrolase